MLRPGRKFLCPLRAWSGIDLHAATDVLVELRLRFIILVAGQYRLALPESQVFVLKLGAQRSLISLPCAVYQATQFPVDDCTRLPSKVKSTCKLEDRIRKDLGFLYPAVASAPDQDVERVSAVAAGSSPRAPVHPEQFGTCLKAGAHRTETHSEFL